MATSFTTSNDVTVNDGDEITLVLLYRGGEDQVAEVEVTGTVHRFDHVEPVYADDPDFGRIISGKTSEERWELLTDDPQYPAIGFLPENVLVRSDS